MDLGLALEQKAGLLAAQGTPGKSKILPVTLKPCKWCHNDSSAALTLSSIQLGKLEPSSVYRADQQRMTEWNLPFHRANHTLSDRGLLLVVQLGWDLGFKNRTESVTSLGALVKWDWPWRLGIIYGVHRRAFISLEFSPALLQWLWKQHARSFKSTTLLPPLPGVHQSLLRQLLATTSWSKSTLWE